MRTPKFKVGDKVKVMRKPRITEKWGDCWMCEMSDTVGQTLTVIYVYGDGPMYTLSPIRLRYPECVLQNEIEVGQQLTFDFMSEAT